MARFVDYLDTSYLPGEVWRASYGEASPVSVLSHEIGKKIKFKPESNIAGKYMKEFSILADNPEAFMNSVAPLPSDFAQMMNYLQSFS